MMTKTYEERINECDTRKVKLQERVKEIEKERRRLMRERGTLQRKERTHRLIQAGAIVADVLDRELTDEDLPRLKSFLESQEKRGGYFSRAMNVEGDSNGS